MNKNEIPEIISDLKKGKMVIILDDESRENEGDLVCAADMITPEIINFMASKGKGLICLPLSKNLINKFDLKLRLVKKRIAIKMLLMFLLKFIFIEFSLKVLAET